LFFSHCTGRSIAIPFQKMNNLRREKMAYAQIYNIAILIQQKGLDT
jgi:hypothetical protein